MSGLTILVVFFIGLAVLTVLFIVVLLLVGFRPQKSKRLGRGFSDGMRDSGGGTGL